MIVVTGERVLNLAFWQGQCGGYFKPYQADGGVIVYHQTNYTHTISPLLVIIPEEKDQKIFLRRIDFWCKVGYLTSHTTRNDLFELRNR